MLLNYLAELVALVVAEERLFSVLKFTAGSCAGAAAVGCTHCMLVPQRGSKPAGFGNAHPFWGAKPVPPSWGSSETLPGSSLVWYNQRVFAMPRMLVVVGFLLLFIIPPSHSPWSCQKTENAKKCVFFSGSEQVRSKRKNPAVHSDL